MMKKSLCFILALFILILSSGCFNTSNMPFNGDISFHDISLTIPERFIRDSTQSNNDRWIFEYQNYTESIILVRSEIGQQNAEDFLNAYRDSMAEVGSSELITFNGRTAVHSIYKKDSISGEELFFPYEGSFYAIALRGGSKTDFEQLIGTILPVAPTTPTE